MSAMASTIQKYIYDQDQYNTKTNKRNFIQENVRHIKKVASGSSRFNKNQNKKKSFRRVCDDDMLTTRCGCDKPYKYGRLGTPETEVELRTYKEKGTQTLSNAKNAYNEGIILYSKSRPKTPRPVTGRKNVALQVSTEPSFSPVVQSDSGKIPVREDGKVDFVKLNATVQLKKKNSSEKPDPTKAPPNYQRGVVPKYLRDAKRQQLEEIKEKGIAEEMDDEKCPPGHVLLSEEEKKEHLKTIRNAYADLVAQLNLLPLKSDSLKVKTKRKNLENDLRKLEDGIKLFSREKLYIKVDSN